jgi:hypothetical protein
MAPMEGYGGSDRVCRRNGMDEQLCAARQKTQV